MSADIATGRTLIDVLTRAALDETVHSRDSQDEITAALRSALLAIGSETPLNVAAVANVEYASAGDDDTAFDVVGPKLVGESILLSHLFWRLEDAPMPAEISKSFPGLSQEKWEAAIRFVVLLLSGLQRDMILPER